MIAHKTNNIIYWDTIVINEFKYIKRMFIVDAHTHKPLKYLNREMFTKDNVNGETIYTTHQYHGDIETFNYHLQKWPMESESQRLTLKFNADKELIFYDDWEGNFWKKEWNIPFLYPHDMLYYMLTQRYESFASSLEIYETISTEKTLPFKFKLQ